MISLENRESTWSIVQICEVADVIRGITFPREVKKTIHAGQHIVCLRTANVQHDIDWDDLWFVDEKYVKRDEQVIRTNDILMSTANSIEHLGKSAIVKHMPLVATLGTFIISIRAQKCVLPKWLYYYFSTTEFKRMVRMNASTTTNISNISTGKLKTLYLPLAPINEQLKIITVVDELFSEIDKGIESLKVIQAQLLVLRKSIFQRAYQCGKTSDDHHESSPLLGEKHVHRSQWEYTELGEIADIRGGITKGRDFKGKAVIKLPYLSVANVQNGYLDLREIREIELLRDEIDKFKLIADDVLYTEGGDKDKLGRGTIWKAEIDLCVHQNHIFRARVKRDKVVPKFLAYYSQSQTARDYFYKNAKQTVNLASINMTVLKKLPIPLPGISEQEQIVQEIEARLSLCDKMEQTIGESLKKAEVLRQSILKKAFEGRLVPQDPGDEPADKLLERIRLEKEAQKPDKKVVGKGRRAKA